MVVPPDVWILRAPLLRCNNAKKNTKPQKFILYNQRLPSDFFCTNLFVFQIFDNFMKIITWITRMQLLVTGVPVCQIKLYHDLTFFVSPFYFWFLFLPSFSRFLSKYYVYVWENFTFNSSYKICAICVRTTSKLFMNSRK